MGLIIAWSWCKEEIIDFSKSILSIYGKNPKTFSCSNGSQHRFCNTYSWTKKQQRDHSPNSILDIFLIFYVFDMYGTGGIQGEKKFCISYQFSQQSVKNLMPGTFSSWRLIRLETTPGSRKSGSSNKTIRQLSVKGICNVAYIKTI